MSKVLKKITIRLYAVFTLCLIIAISYAGKTAYDRDKAKKIISEASVINYNDFVEVSTTEDNKTTEEISTEIATTEEPKIIIEPREQYETITEEVTTEEVVDKNHGFSDDDIYLLARITMAEVEAASLTCKEYVVSTVLNRLYSDKFPNTVHDVIFQTNQFTPTFDGRWERVPVPNDECYEAVYNVIAMDTTPIDSLYFESCNGSSWHSNNLNLLVEEDGMRFYN